MDRKINSFSGLKPQSPEAEESPLRPGSQRAESERDAFAADRRRSSMLKTLGHGFYNNSARAASIDVAELAPPPTVDPHALDATAELLQNERDFLSTLTQFKRLYHDPTLMDQLSASDKEWVLQHQSAIDKAWSSVGSFVQQLHQATNASSSDNLSAKLKTQGPAQQEQSIGNVLAAFKSPAYENLMEALPGLVQAHSAWEDLAKRNENVVRSRSGDLNGQDKTLAGHGFNPATPAMQRSFRYALTLSELAKNLPEHLQPQGQEALASARRLAEAANQSQPSKEESPPGSRNSAQGSRFKRLLRRNSE